MKDLFVPLKTEWFLAFETGEKDTEWRPAGPRWNDKTLTKGRRVTLSHGYNGRRLYGRIESVEYVGRDKAPKAAHDIYSDCQIFAKIKISQICVTREACTRET